MGGVTAQWGYAPIPERGPNLVGRDAEDAVSGVDERRHLGLLGVGKVAVAVEERGGAGPELGTQRVGVRHRQPQHPAPQLAVRPAHREQQTYGAHQRAVVVVTAWSPTPPPKK